MKDLDKFLKPRESKLLKLRPKVTSVEDGSSIVLEIDIHSATSSQYRSAHTLIQHTAARREKAKTTDEAQKRADEDSALFMCSITESVKYDGEDLDKDTLYKLYVANPELVRWLDGEANVDAVFIRPAPTNSGSGANAGFGSGKKSAKSQS